MGTTVLRFFSGVQVFYTRDVRTASTRR